jgi:hypothetical protein
MEAFDAKSEPLKHAITSTGSPNKALVVAFELPWRKVGHTYLSHAVLPPMLQVPSKFRHNGSN